MVLKKGIRLVVLGGATGLLGAVVLSRFLETLLFGVGALDALTYVVVSLVLGGVMLVATVLPVRRALKVDPTIALQVE